MSTNLDGGILFQPNYNADNYNRHFCRKQFPDCVWCLEKWVFASIWLAILIQN